MEVRLSRDLVETIVSSERQRQVDQGDAQDSRNSPIPVNIVEGLRALWIHPKSNLNLDMITVEESKSRRWKVCLGLAEARQQYESQQGLFVCRRQEMEKESGSPGDV